MEVEELQPGRTTSYAVSSYVHALLKLRALRRELAQTLLEVERRKKTLTRRSQPEVLLAEAQRLLEELGIEAVDDDRSGLAP